MNRFSSLLALIRETWPVVAGAFAVVITVAGAIVVIALVFGGIRTRGDYLDWTVVSALATVAAATATVLAVGALGMAARELDHRAREARRQAEIDRVARQPYLRVDVALPGITNQGFVPPPTSHVYDASDFDPSDGLRHFDDVSPRDPPYDGTLGPLVLWVTNLQIAPLAIAYEVRVRILVAWDETDPAKAAEATVSFTYLAPGQTTAFKLTDVRNDVGWLLAKVTEVSYEDLFGSERLPEAHGALTMLYDRTTGVRNDRSYQLSR